MRPMLMVSSVVPGLIALSACCGKTPPPSEQVYEFPAGEVDFEGLLDDGELSAQDCEALCRSHADQVMDVVDSVVSCGELPGTQVPTTATGTSTGDTGAVEPEVWITCTAMATEQCIGGRDHACADRVHAGVGRTPVAAWLGAQAHAEASSVRSFVVLAGELRRFGAPAELVDLSVGAARDEIAHARILGRLAAARGGRPGQLVFPAAEERTLLAFAVENAVEGCVRETWAALVAAWQAEHADSGEIRAAFSRIARDEARHGDLAWAIDAWVSTRLDEGQRAIVRRAREEAIAEVVASIAEPDEALARDVGLPCAERARELLRGLDQALWRAAA